MQYLLLIYGDERIVAGHTPDERRAMHDDYMQYTKALREAGKLIAGDALESVRTATTVRVRDGKTLMTDGPFAETKEQLGGYYLIEASDLDDALAWAARIPASKTGSIEVRPVMVFG